MDDGKREIIGVRRYALVREKKEFEYLDNLCDNSCIKLHTRADEKIKKGCYDFFIDKINSNEGKSYYRICKTGRNIKDGKPFIKTMYYKRVGE